MAEHPAREALEQTVEAVVEKYAPVAVLLFGSLASGDFSPAGSWIPGRYFVMLE